MSPYLFVNLQELLHSHFFVPGYPQGSVDTPKAASSTVLIEDQVLMLYLHKRRARGRHGILTHAQTNSHIHTHTHTQPPPKKSVHTRLYRRCPEEYTSQKSAQRVKGEKRGEWFPHRVSVDVVSQKSGLSKGGGGRKKKVLEGEREVCSQ